VIKIKEYCYVSKKHDGIYLDCSYDPDFLEVFKNRIPAQDRKWHPDIKQWWVSSKWAKQAIRDAQIFFNEIIEC
jgi:hypothetical protein